MAKRKPSILVVGSINMDLVLQTERAPLAGESFIGDEYGYVPGGKGANVAVSAARLGADVTFVGRIGDDAHGAKLKEQLEAQGISTEFLAVDQERQTGLAVITVEASGQNRIIVYPGANMAIRKEDVARAFEHSYDAVMSNLEIAQEIVVEVSRQAGCKDIPVVLDAGPAQSFDLGRMRRLEILTPNETETMALTGMECRTPQEAEAAARALAKASQAHFIVIKMGEQGALLYGEETCEFFPAHKVEAVDATAAGDAFTAAMTVHYLRHGDMGKAVRYANVAGALTVTRLGAQPSLPTSDEVKQFTNDRGIRL